ncbi:MAG: hypothetical protein R3310_16770, partial [Candidatus Competibacteraceae bacterium]|nr:hypothetical protein [Candidatus Competibacteraceae bacterium]
MPYPSLQLSDAPPLSPAPTQSLDDLAELVGELERQWQNILSQNCTPSYLKELCCLTPLLTGEDVPERMAGLARKIDTTLRTHVEAKTVPGVEDRQKVTAALIQLKACLQGGEAVESAQIPLSGANPSLICIVADDP